MHVLRLENRKRMIEFLPENDTSEILDTAMCCMHDYTLEISGLADCNCLKCPDDMRLSKSWILVPLFMSWCMLCIFSYVYSPDREMITLVSLQHSLVLLGLEFCFLCKNTVVKSTQ